jgi:hypothetical protein
LGNAVSFCGPDRIMFGTDACVPAKMGNQPEHIRLDLEIFGKLGLDAKQIETLLDELDWCLGCETELGAEAGDVLAAESLRVFD